MLGFLLSATVFILSSCAKKTSPGFLTIHSASAGEPSDTSENPVEIFRISGSDKEFALIGEIVGNVNEKVDLTPGTYLVMADCSHELIVVRPNEHIELNLAKVRFIPPPVKLKERAFSVQCDRFKASIFRQSHYDKFELSVLTGKRSLLVNMTPVEINFDKAYNLGPITKGLAALRLGEDVPADSRVENEKYFVSRYHENLSLTQSVTLGHWFVGLPGTYEVSINGTTKEISLAEGDVKSLPTGKVSIYSPKDTDLKAIELIKNQPFTVNLQDHHELSINRPYHVIPGPVSIRFPDTGQKTTVNVSAGGLVEIDLKSVTVRLDCAPWEWSCMGKGEVLLYKKGESFPFAESRSDMPILYFDEPLEVGLAGSKGIKASLPEKRSQKTYHTGTLVVIPSIRLWPGVKTDLVRLETVSKHLDGSSIDIPADLITKMRLITGLYHIASFHASKDDERNKTTRSVYIGKNKTVTVNVPFYVTESQYKRIKPEIAKKKKRLPGPLKSPIQLF